MIENVFPPKVERLANLVRKKHKDVLAEVAACAAELDHIVDVPGLYAESLISAAALAMTLCRETGQTLGYFSATRYMGMIKRNGAICGFDSAEEMLEDAEVMVISELSLVPSSVSSILDGYIYRRWAEDQRTIVCGYNIPPARSRHEAETIDGYSGYPLLSSRIGRTVLYWDPKFYKDTGRL